MRYLNTLQRKVGAALAVAVLLSFAVQIGVQAVLQRASMTDSTRHEVTVKTGMLATAARAGFLAGDVYSIETEFKPLAEREDSTLAGVAAFDRDGNLLLDFRSERLPGPDMTDLWTAHQERLAALETVSYSTGDAVVVAVPVTNRKGTKLNGVMAVAWSLHRQNAAVLQATAWGSAVSIAGMVVLVAVLAWLVGRMISRPLARVTDALTRVADGDLDAAVEESGRDDEIGAIARTVAVFRANAEHVTQLTGAQARSAEERRRDMLALADSLENSVKRVTTALGAAAAGMQSSAQSMTRAADDTSSRSSAVASTADVTSTNVQTVASAIEELSSSVQDIRRQVEQSTSIANRAVAEAEHTNETMRGLSEAAEKVGAIVQMITGIAEQTNLLALNATIEAARAGEAGKGFAVVASEVKSLATQTAKATEDIAQQVAGIQSVTGEAVAAITHIGQVIGEISRIAGAIAESVEQQGQATQEIARNTTEVVAGVHEVSETIGEVNRAADTARTAAGQVATAADKIAEQSEALDHEVERFLAQVRA